MQQTWKISHVFWRPFVPLSDQGTFTPVGAQGGEGGSKEPLEENHFPTGSLQWNLHHIWMHYKKKIIILEKINKMLHHFKMAAKNRILFRVISILATIIKTNKQTNKGIFQWNLLKVGEHE